MSVFRIIDPPGGAVHFLDSARVGGRFWLAHTKPCSKGRAHVCVSMHVLFGTRAAMVFHSGKNCVPLSVRAEGVTGRR